MYLYIFIALLVKANDVNCMYWPGLHATWGPSTPENPFAFKEMPFTTKNAVKEGWNLINENDCYSGGLFSGYRYIHENDPSYALIFDKSGYLSGSQFNLLISELEIKPSNYQYASVPNFVRNKVLGQDVYSLTTYFTEPASICEVGRGWWQVWKEGLGKNLFFQQGKSSELYYQVPNSRDEAALQRWSKSGCYNGMGYHSYFAVETVGPTNCSMIYPFVLLYDKDNGALMGFVYMTVGYGFSPRFEHPSAAAVSYILGSDAVQCMKDIPKQSGFSQLHQYFIQNPEDYKCPTPPLSKPNATTGSTPAQNGRSENLYRGSQLYSYRI